MDVSSLLIHPTAIVDAGAQLGEGTRIWHWVHISAGAVIGAHCSFGQGVFVGNRVQVGNRVRVQNNVSIYDDVELEDDVFCGPSMVFTNVINPRAHVSRKHEYRRTLVRRGASVGANATIVCGNTIGEFAFVGAGAVVTRDVADHSLVAGVPAKRIGWICRCGQRLDAPRALPAVASGKKLEGAGEAFALVACADCREMYRIGREECLRVDAPVSQDL